jgi:hypothetical protein
MQSENKHELAQWLRKAACNSHAALENPLAVAQRLQKPVFYTMWQGAMGKSLSILNKFATSNIKHHTYF